MPYLKVLEAIDRDRKAGARAAVYAAAAWERLFAKLSRVAASLKAKATAAADPADPAAPPGEAASS